MRGVGVRLAAPSGHQRAAGRTPGGQMGGPRPDRESAGRSPPRPVSSRGRPMNPTRLIKRSAKGGPPGGGNAPAIALRDVRKVHGQGDGAVVALDGVSARFERGSFTAIMGPSGSGKSTFLHVAAGLDRPTSGTVALGDTELAGLSERRLTILRRERIGFV